ncbi:hypothetical protein C4587_01870 [Candidatus Parcubacteria bacterium]|nr:MAG: hypothetical protein C4587_01870 [Candidatus Parcubacteria bacterium]
MKIKEGVRLAGIRPEMLLALFIWAEICREYGIEAEITGGMEGVHSPGSLHYVFLANDVSRKEPDRIGKTQEMVSKLRFNLNASTVPGKGDYDVVLEGTHIHIEFQPKKDYIP